MAAAFIVQGVIVQGGDELTRYGDAPELLGRSSDADTVLKALVQVADTAELYLVGGSVRDLLLGHPGRDLDVVVEAPVEPLATALQHQLGGKLTAHTDFLTSTLTLSAPALPGLTLDLATARREHYPHPGALPVVEVSDLSHDLHRRDFSVNTFALRLREPHTLLSVAGAKADLEAQTLRTLHERSFFDDPTRMVRGSRLAGRLGFDYDHETRQQLADALKAKVYERVSPARLKNELLLTLAEPAVAPALTHLAESGALTAYGLRDTPRIAQLDALETNPPAESYLLALLLPLSSADAAAHVRRFSWPERLLKARTRLLAAERPRTDAERALHRVLQPDSAEPRLRGSDVLSLGLPAGPEVGRVLRRVGRARRDGQVASFAAELELAKRLVYDIHKRENA